MLLEIGNEFFVSGLIVEICQFIGIILQVVKLPLVEVVEVDELVGLGADAIVAWNHVDAGVFVVVVVDRFPPIG